MDEIKFKLALLADLHIKPFKNNLDLMVDRINKDEVDLVIIAGDTVHDKDDEVSFELASKSIKKIESEVVIIPGEHDCGTLWTQYFGDSTYKSKSIKNYCLNFLDTSYLGSKFSVGWGATLENYDKKQHKWLKESLNYDGRFHLIFSHHPIWIKTSSSCDKYLTNNVRGLYSGHLRAAEMIHFVYNKPMSWFDQGFSCIPVNFHGNASYSLILVGEDDRILHAPIIVTAKQTAW